MESGQLGAERGGQCTANPDHVVAAPKMMRELLEPRSVAPQEVRKISDTGWGRTKTCMLAATT
eukprot:SAG22_NODE_20998_length_261_cov_0.444444_1_plen_62_part_10